jgi:hypothetical protein
MNVKPGDQAYYVKYRPVFVTGPSISPNLAGRVASSFALCYTLLQQTDPQIASTCLSYGQTIFAYANVSFT